MERSAEKGSGVMNAMGHFPFMGHVLVVLVITYLFLSFTSNGFFYFCFFIVYLFEVERRGRERERYRIASEERRKMNTRRTFDEGETLRWLNEGIKSIWPVCMEKFASKHIFGPMVPEFLNIYKPWGVNEVKIDSLHLGSTPPVFNFVRALERPAEGDHVVYESTMEFCSGDDMNAKMSVQTIRRFGGFWTTFYISRLHVEGTVRISVKFLKGWPVVGRVRLCFTSKPQVTMSYRPIDRNGIDVSLIPFLANIVEKMVDNAMEHSIVQPNIFVVDIEKLVNTMFSDSKAQGATGIFKVENKSTLVVEILEGTNLKAADSNGLSDPFVEITFGQHQKKTKVKKKTLNPKWENEQHEFPIRNWDMSNLLTLRVRDWDRVPTIGSSHELGICTVPVNEYRHGERRELDLPLEKVSKGRLRFAITVNYTHRPQVAQEPPANNSGREIVTQEIKTSSSAVNYALSNRESEITRSKSETNLERLRTPLSFEESKRSSQNSSGEPMFLEPSHEQNPNIGDSHDVIHMPYGPPGAFTIFHPGLVSPLRFPSPKKATEPLVIKSSELDKGGGAEIKQRRLRYFQRRKRRSSRGTNCHENVLVDTMSEGDSTSSVDFLADLKDFIPEPYHGPVRLTLDCPRTTDIVPAEPPLMDQVAPLSVNSDSVHLEPILSGKTPPMPAINMFFGSAEDDLTAFGTGAAVDTRNSPLLSSGPKERASAVTDLNVEGPNTDKLADLPASSSGSHPQRRPKSSPKRQSAKPILSLPTTWYKKMTLLAKRGKRKNRHENGDVVYSSELKHPSGYSAECDRPVPFYHEDSDTSIPSGPQTAFLFESPLDTKRIANAGGTPGTAHGGDSPEQRKIINSRSSSASGSQSDRHWASKVKKLIPDQFRTSQSFRHESLDLRRLQTPIRDSSLESIPERSGKHRNGSISASFCSGSRPSTEPIEAPIRDVESLGDRPRFMGTGRRGCRIILAVAISP